MNWLESVSPSLRAELNEAGRVGAGRFSGPLHTCIQCDEQREYGSPLERGGFLCDGCKDSNRRRFERMTNGGES